MPACPAAGRECTLLTKCLHLEQLESLLIACDEGNILSIDGWDVWKECSMFWRGGVQSMFVGDECYNIAVHDCPAFLVKVKNMVQTNKDLWIWKKRHTDNVTLGVYETMRRAGMVPRVRGPNPCPGKTELMYFSRWSVRSAAFYTSMLKLQESRKRKHED